MAGAIVAPWPDGLCNANMNVSNSFLSAHDAFPVHRDVASGPLNGLFLHLLCALNFGLDITSCTPSFAGVGLLLATMGMFLLLYYADSHIKNQHTRARECVNAAQFLLSPPLLNCKFCFPHFASNQN